MIEKVSPEEMGIIMAVLIAILRVINDRKETDPLRILLDSVLCGALTLTVSAGIRALDLDLNWSIFAGGMIGLYGTVAVRAFAVRYFKSKID